MLKNTLRKMLNLMLISIFLSAFLPFTHMVADVKGQTTVVKIMPSSQTVGDPDEPLNPDALLFNITVRVENVEDLFAWQVYLTYDTNILTTKAEWIDLHPDDDVFEGKTTIDPDPVVNDTVGFLQVGRSILFGSSTFNGSGALCTIGFSAQKPGSSTLNINNTDTILLNSARRDISHTRENGFVTVQGIEGELQPTNITISVKPTKAYLGETIHINGSVSPVPPEGIQVSVYRRNPTSGVDSLIAAVNVTGDGKYEYDWDTWDTKHLFYGETKVLSRQIFTKVLWMDGTKIFSNESQKVDVTITKPSTILTVIFANKTQKNIGSEDQLLTEVPPVTFNVTVKNVTDLVSWKIKIYYPSDHISFDCAWIPPDNIFGDNYTASQVETGTDEDGDYIMLSANTTGNPFSTSTNGTLFQMNFTAIFPTAIFGLPPEITFSRTDTELRNSTNHRIPMFPESCSVSILGIVSKLRVYNPEESEGKEHIFEFFADKTSVGSRFNVTILISNASDLFAWKIVLTYDNMLLKATNAWFPNWNETTDILYGKEINSTLTKKLLDNEKGNVTLIGYLTSGEHITGEGFLALIEFEILQAPEKGKSLTCKLEISHKDETVLSSDGEKWYNPITSDGVYYFRGETSPEGGEEGAFDWASYVIFGVIVGILVVLVALYWRKKRKFAREYGEEI